jgi:hypothetical protein
MGMARTSDAAIAHEKLHMHIAHEIQNFSFFYMVKVRNDLRLS